MQITVTVLHVDGKTKVKAKGILIPNKNEVNLEYRFEGMTYGRTLTIDELKSTLDTYPQQNRSI